MDERLGKEIDLEGYELEVLEALVCNAIEDDGDADGDLKRILAKLNDI